MKHTYELPVSRLLWIGAPERRWRSYRGMGLTEADVPELFRLLRDRSFEEWHPPESWAQVHAWRALAEFQTPELIPDILNLLDEGDGLDCDEQLFEDRVEIAERVGPEALPFYKAYLKDTSKDAVNRWTAGAALAAIAKSHPSTRAKVTGLLESILKTAEDNFVLLNTGAMSELVGLGSRESIDLIRHVMNARLADESVRGPLERIEFDLGFRDRPPMRVEPDLLLDEADTPEDIAAMKSMVETLAAQEKAEQTGTSAKARADRPRKVAKATKKRGRGK